MIASAISTEFFQKKKRGKWETTTLIYTVKSDTGMLMGSRLFEAPFDKEEQIEWLVSVGSRPEVAEIAAQQALEN